jgi:hypothetical protein
MTTTPSSSFPRALIIRANGHTEVVENTGLACLQEAVGGYIEAIHLGSVAVMYVNEEGLLREEIANNHNFSATKIALQYNPGLYHPIVGDVIITGFDPSTGEDCDFPDEIGEDAVMIALGMDERDNDPEEEVGDGRWYDYDRGEYEKEYD